MILKSAETGVVSALFGFLAALVTFKAQFAMIQRNAQLLAEKVEQDRKADRERYELDRAHDKELLARELTDIRKSVARHSRATRRQFANLNRKSTVVLELVAAIAAKNGVNHRALGVDALATLITDGDVSDNRKR